MLFGIYLGTTAYVWYDMIKHFKEMDKRLKREGYEFTNLRYTLSDVLLGIIILLVLSIPVVNLLGPLVNGNKDRSYDEYKNYLLEAGAIEKDESFDKPKVISKEDKIAKVDEISYLLRSKNIEELERRINIHQDLDNEIKHSYQKVYKKK